MTKAELEKEAKEKWWDEDTVSGASTPNRIFVTGYLAGAEPREKKIKSLGERCLQLQKDKGELIDKVRELEKENAELKELLKQWLQTSNASDCDNINIVTDTEQFLKECK